MICETYDNMTWCTVWQLSKHITDNSSGFFTTCLIHFSLFPSTCEKTQATVNSLCHNINALYCTLAVCPDTEILIQSFLYKTLLFIYLLFFHLFVYLIVKSFIYAHEIIFCSEIPSIPDGVIGIFQWHNPAGRTMALGSTQPLTEMSTRVSLWGKGGRCVEMTNSLP